MNLHGKHLNPNLAERLTIGIVLNKTIFYSITLVEITAIYVPFLQRDVEPASV